MTTAKDLIRLALHDSGAFGSGRVPAGQDFKDMFLRLNMMLGQWRRKRWLVYRLDTFSVASDGRLEPYSVGPGGDINISSRPDRLESAFVRLTTSPSPNLVDYTLRIIQSREDYNRIVLKSLTSFPANIFYEPRYPLGALYPWPVPTANIYSLFVSFKLNFESFQTLEDEVHFPEEYQAAIYHNLIIRSCMAYRLQSSPEMAALAIDSLNVLRQANVAIAKLTIDPSLKRGGVYDPYSDQVR